MGEEQTIEQIITMQEEKIVLHRVYYIFSLSLSIDKKCVF